MAAQIAGELKKRHGFLRIGRYLAHQNRSLDSFLVSHDENVWRCVFSRRRHLLSDAFVEKPLVDHDAFFAEYLKNGKRAAARLRSQVRVIDGRHAGIFAFYARTAMHLAGNAYHRGRHGSVSETRGKRVIAAAECK